MPNALPSSETALRFKPSRDYLKLACCLHALALVSLLKSNLTVSAIAAMTLVLVWSLLGIVRYPYPQAKGLVLRWDSVRVRLDTGWFLLLTRPGQKKLLLIFHDQITEQDLKRLHRMKSQAEKAVVD